MRIALEKHDGKFLGKGQYGKVYENKNDVDVTKIALNQGGMKSTEMPWEFCMSFEANSPYIAHVKPRSNMTYFDYHFCQL